MQLTLRQHKKAEEPFIISSWLKSYRNSPYVRFVDNDTYYKKQAAIILERLRDSNCVVATDPEDDNVVWGFIVHDEQLLHYVYVKHLLRLNGIARTLWMYAGKPTQATCLTHAGEAILKAKGDIFTFDPY